MKLREFAGRFARLPDLEFLRRFPFPFLLERDEEIEVEDDRRVFLILSARVESPVTLGRSARNHISIGDVPISSEHAKLIPPPGPEEPWRLVDRHSTNGTTVDGERVRPGEVVPLRAGASLGFGPISQFWFLDSTAFLRELRRRYPQPPDDPDREDELSGTQLVPPTPIPGEMLVVCEGHDPLPLCEGESIRIGRDAGTAELVLADLRVSRVHTEIQRRPEGLFVRDLGSSNGSFLGGRRLGREWTPLAVDQAVAIAHFRIAVQEPQSAPVSGSTRRLSISATRSMDRIIRGIRGDLSETPLTLLLQQIEGSEDSGILDVDGMEVSGRLTFMKGHPLQAATTDGQRGADAILRLLDETQGRFHLHRLGTPAIDSSLEEILLKKVLLG